MKNDRRDFLKMTGAAGLGITGAVIFEGCGSKSGTSTDEEEPGLDQQIKKMEESHVQQFNMAGYAAPAIETVG